VGLDAYAPFTGVDALARERYSAYVPVFSFYTGSAMADVPMPTCDDWATATGKWLPWVSASPYMRRREGPLAPVPTRRTQVAVFRGAATGSGVTSATNARLRLAEFAMTSPDRHLVDVRLTGFNLRDRVVAVSEPCPEAPPRVTVDFFRDFHKFSAVRGPFQSLHDQEAAFEYVLYVDGHCAASRFGTLLATSMVVLRVASDHPDTCGHLWLFDTTAPLKVQDGDDADDADPSTESRFHLSGTPPEAADHCLISSDLSNLGATVRYLRSHEAVARGVVARANARAPTIEAITTHWHAMLLGVHALETGGSAAAAAASAATRTPQAGSEWFSPYDPKYACVEMDT
jgi:hypothetical protein